MSMHDWNSSKDCRKRECQNEKNETWCEKPIGRGNMWGREIDRDR